MDVPNSELELLVWVRQSWKDRRLAWNPADYGGIDQMSYHARMGDAMEDGDVWMPDLELYNTPGSLHSLSNKPVMLWLVKHTHLHTLTSLLLRLLRLMWLRPCMFCVGQV